MNAQSNQEHDQIRRDQLSYGNEKLSLKKPVSKPRPEFKSNRPKPNKRKLDAHEMDIKQSISDGSVLEFWLSGSSDNTIRGKVVKFDKYTIKLDSGLWLFKHAIAGMKVPNKGDK